LSNSAKREETQSQLTVLLNRMQQGDREAGNRAAEMVHDELHRIAARVMRREGPGHEFQATVLINEAYLRLTDGVPQNIRSREDFFRLACREMRRVLVDEARKRKAARRGSCPIRIDLSSLQIAATTPDNALLLLNDALEELTREYPELAKIVELKFFGGLTDCAVAEELGVSLSTIRRQWERARARLHVLMSSRNPER
jgi:RNA polymerase sigma factor (TIGR02999 family)